MQVYEFKPISVSVAQAASTLLFERQGKEAEVISQLKTCRRDGNFINQILSELFGAKNVLGTAAYKNGELAGYLAGKIQDDQTRGRHVWIPYEGFAIKRGETGELLRHLYAKASAIWVSRGCFDHYGVVPLGEKSYLSSFLDLSFAKEQVHAVLDLSKYNTSAERENAKIRRAGSSDREMLGMLSSIIPSYQSSAPTYAPVLPETAADIKEGYESMADDEEATVYIAEHGGKAAGFQAYWPMNHGLMSPEKAVELGVAGTVPDYRGLGIGTELMNFSAKELLESGIRYICTDWRIANPASSTFWPKLGFKPVAVRMVRKLDKRIAWAVHP